MLTVMESMAGTDAMATIAATAHISMVSMVIAIMDTARMATVTILIAIMVMQTIIQLSNNDNSSRF